MGFSQDPMLEASLTHETDMYKDITSNLCIIYECHFFSSKTCDTSVHFHVFPTSWILVCTKLSLLICIYPSEEIVLNMNNVLPRAK